MGKNKEAKPKEAKQPKPKKEPKPKAPLDPVKTRNLIRLLNILALLVAIIAFFLQLFAVLGHHWKRQSTTLHPIVSSTYNHPQQRIYEDARLDQNYGLFSREVKLFADQDQVLDLWGSTRFPRLDTTEEDLNHCLSQSTSLRGAFLACSDQVASSQTCSCRRHPYWNAVIVFEILALIFLGIVVVLLALQTTHLHAILKPVAAGLALLAFICLLIGLILILSYLKRETKSFADAYPHIYHRLANKMAHIVTPDREPVYYDSSLRRAVSRRQVTQTYRIYSLSQGQHPYNETHFQEYSEELRAWVYRPYSSLIPVGPYAPYPAESRGTFAPVPRRDPIASTTTVSTTTIGFNQYGPVVGYDQVFENTDAAIGCSTVLSILALILALLLPLIVIFSWLKQKALTNSTKTGTTTTVADTKYVPLPQDVTGEAIALTETIPPEYDIRRPISDSVTTVRNIQQGAYDVYQGRGEPIIVRDFVIPGDNAATLAQSIPATTVRTLQEHSFPVNVETTTTTNYRS